MLLTALSCVAAGATAQDVQDGQAADNSTHFGWADVLRVDPVHDQSRGEGMHEECTDDPVQRSSRHSSGGGGALLGAVVGGVLGHTVGKGDGRRAATVGGAVIGGVVGNNVARSGDNDSYTTTERHCIQVPDDVVDDPAPDAPRIVAYDVEYRYRGEVYMSRLAYDPGDRLRVRVSVSPAE